VALRLMASVKAATMHPQESAVLRFVRHLLNDSQEERVFSSIAVIGTDISLMGYGDNEDATSCLDRSVRLTLNIVEEGLLALFGTGLL
jgi:hypothetical protein